MVLKQFMSQTSKGVDVILNLTVQLKCTSRVHIKHLLSCKRTQFAIFQNHTPVNTRKTAAK